MKLLLLVTGLLFSCCTTLQTADSPRQEVQLETSVETTGEDPVATIEMTNTGPHAIAVTKTFGLSDLFIHIEIESLSGERVEYPANSQFEIFSEPGYNCLGPGDTMQLEVNLRRWYHVLGGITNRTQAVPETGPYSFPLRPGKYRLKTVYDAPPSQKKSRRCPRIDHPIESDWVDFTIP